MLIFRNVLRQNLIQIYTEIHQIAQIFSKFLEGTYMPPNDLSMRAAIISFFLYKNIYVLFKILLKYTLKRIDCNTFSKPILGASYKYPITSVYM